MGFFDKLHDAVKGMVDDADKAFARIVDASAFRSVVLAGFLIARADGSIDDSEKAKLQALIAKKFPHFKTTDIVKALKDAESELELSVTGGTQMLLNEISKQAGTDNATLVMVAVLAVAEADGTVDDAEKAMAKQIATRLGLKASDYGL